VWVTQEIESQFVPREGLRYGPEVHVAGVCVDSRSEKSLHVLLARRSDRRELYPGLIEGCGGQLAPSESFADGVRRHFRLELGIDVRVRSDIHCLYEIRLPDRPLIPGVRFLCERIGDHEPRSANHSKVWWVSESALRRLPASEFIPGMKDQWLGLLRQYKQP
jgi:8-oxo-dGTP pyrophosphatase MutT (NUDIX family)